MKDEKELLEILRDKFLRDINQFLKMNKGTSIFVPLATLVGTSLVLLRIADKKNKFSVEIDNYSKVSLHEGVDLMEKILKENKSEN